MAEEKHQNKVQEERRLIEFAKQNAILLNNLPIENFISCGAEQQVNLNIENDVQRILKLIHGSLRTQRVISNKFILSLFNI